MRKLLLSLVMMLTAASAWAQMGYVEQGGLRFSLWDSDPKYAQVEAPASGTYSGEITIPSVVSDGVEDYTVKYIGGNAFKESAVTKVTVPSSVTHILGSAFQGCANLTEVNLSEGLEEISSYVFQGSAVTSLTIPGTVTTVQSYAMEAMTSLTKLTFAYGAAELAMDWSVFNGTNNVTELVVDRYYTFGNGNGISYETVKKVTFGEHLTTIPYSVCQGMSLNELNVGANVTAVGPYAFFKCTLPAGYNFPFAQIKEIKDGAFYLTKNLPANLDLSGVEIIEESAFANCELQSVILPMGVTRIGNGAFSYVENLKVYAPWLTSPASLANPDDTDNHQYQFYFDNATLYVPAGTMDTYKAQVGWKEFSAFEYWSFSATATVTGKGLLKMSNGEAVHANGTNTEKTVTGTKLVAEGASDPVSGLFVREKDLTLTSTPARGYELSTLTANTTDVKAAGKVANLLADQTIAGTFTPIVYPITYNLGGGTVATANPATYTVEDAAITLVNPTRTAYNFKGWTGTDLTAPTMTVVIPASSIGEREYTATWEPIVYPITYTLGEGAALPSGKTNPAEYTIETPDFTLNNPEKTGYTFTGWTGTDLTDKTLEVTVTTGHYGNRSYTATWEPNPYKVHFDINGGYGTETMADQNFVYDTEQALTANAFTRTGYTFKEWNSKADGTGTPYADKASVKNLTATRDAVVTMYAQWTPNPYQVAFDANGGTGTMANQDFVYDTEQALTQNAFTRRGYTFKEWNTMQDGLGVAYADKASVKNLTPELNAIYKLFAQWQVITYTLSYDLAGGSVATANPATYTVESETFTLTNPTKTGYTFAGWTGTELTEPTLTVTIAKGSIENRSYTATWTPNPYKVHFNANNGIGTMADQDFVYDTEQALTQNAFTRNGYTFKEWNTKADGTGTPYADKASVKNLTTEANAVFNVYAQWQVITYAIAYDLAGGTVATANPTSYNVESAAITLNNPTKNHYDFAGWTGTGLTEPTQTVIIAKGSTGDRSYTATWEKKTYAVSLTSSNPELVSFSTTSPKYQDNVEVTITDSPVFELIEFTVDGIDHLADLDANGKYTIANVEDNVTVKVNFSATTPLTIGETEWATFASDKALSFSSVAGLKAYIVTGHDADGKYATMEEVTTIPANTPVLLNGAAGDYDIPLVASSTTDVSANKLKRGTGAPITAVSGKTRYVLSKEGTTAVFLKIASNPATVATNKAYLEYDEVLAAPQIDFGGATGIKAIRTLSPEDELYDLQGRKIERLNKKGLYIKNGKKVVIK